MNNKSRDIQLEKQIDAYIRGHLTEDEIDLLWVELLKKPRYIDLLETELHVRAVIKQRKQATPIHFFTKYWKWMVAAAFVGVLVVALNLIGDSEVEKLALTSINVTEHLASVDVIRTKEPDLTEAEVLLNAGFKAAVSGRTSHALQSFERITGNYASDVPTVSQAYYNIGILHYNSGNFTEAAASFIQALERREGDTVFEEETRWFLAHTYLQLNQAKQARKELEQVYSMDGMYRRQASNMLEKLNAEQTERGE